MQLSWRRKMHVPAWIVKGALPPLIRLLFPRFADEFAQEAYRFYGELEKLEQRVKELEEQVKKEKEKFQNEQKAWQQRHADQYDLIVKLRTALRALLDEE